MSRVLFPGAAERQESKKAVHQAWQQGGKVRPTLNVKTQLHETAPVLKDSVGESRSFYIRASRYRGLLHFVAHRVLGNSDRAHIAVQNCLDLASRDHKAFDSESAFRGWLVRIAIDEALASLHGRRSEDCIVLIAK